MNVFVLDLDPIVAAQSLCDVHVVKMPTESGQMLSTAIRRYVEPTVDLYETTHANHPCTKWVGDTRSNFDWLVRHAVALVAEYDRRYAKPGKYERLRRVLANCMESSDSIPAGPLTEFPQAMPEKYRIPGSPAAAYRQYYVYDKASFARWNKNRQPPQWWPQAA